MFEDPGGRQNCNPAECVNYEPLRSVYVPVPDAETAALWIARRLAMRTRGGGTQVETRGLSGRGEAQPVAPPS